MVRNNGLLETSFFVVCDDIRIAKQPPVVVVERALSSKQFCYFIDLDPTWVHQGTWERISFYHYLNLNRTCDCDCEGYNLEKKKRLKKTHYIIVEHGALMEYERNIL